MVLIDMALPETRFGRKKQGRYAVIVQYSNIRYQVKLTGFQYYQANVPDSTFNTAG